MTENVRPLPHPSPETMPFWKACREKRFLLPRCHRCGTFWFPPSGFCPDCWSREWDWEEAQGTGTLFSYVIFRRQFHPAFVPPYAVGVVALTEGPQILIRILTESLQSLMVGMAMELTWEMVDDNWTLPAFRPVLSMLSQVGNAGSPD